MWLSYFFGFFTWNIIAILSLLAINYNYRIKKSQQKLLYVDVCVLCFLIGTLGCAMTNDFYPYQGIISVINSTKDPAIHIEEFWVKTISNFHLSYYEYIFYLELISFSLFYIILKQLNLNNPVLFISLWILFCLRDSIGGRAILFSMTFILGVTLFSNRRYLLGLLLILISFYFHKTAIIGIPLFILSLIQFSRKQLFCIFLTIVSLVLILRLTFLSNINLIYETLAGADVPGAIYITYEENRNTTGMIIWRIIPIVAAVITTILYLLVIYRLSYHIPNLSFKQKTFFYLAFWGLTFSIALRMLNLPADTISARTMTIIAIPVIYLYSSTRQYLKPKKYERKLLFINLLILFILSNIHLLRVMFINDIFK